MPPYRICLNTKKLCSCCLERVSETYNDTLYETFVVHITIVVIIVVPDINYFYCKRIIEILKETEVDTKNLFGSYGSQRMKDWLEIERLYLKDNIYLAEACDLLAQNIKYHIPSIKKQIARAQSGQTVSWIKLSKLLYRF